MTEQPTQQITREQFEEAITRDYLLLKGLGNIYYEFDDKISSAVMARKIFNQSTGELIETITLPYTSNDLARRRIARDNKRSEIELKILDLQDQLRAHDLAESAIQADIEAEIRSLEEKHQPSNPQLSPRNQEKRNAEIAEELKTE